MFWKTAFVLVAAVGISAPLGWAHPHDYVNGPLLVCDTGAGVSVGGVCFPHGHLGPNSVVSIQDVLVSPVSATACYSLDSTLSCDFSFPFCGSVLVASGVGALRAIIFDGPVNGSPLLSPCGTFSMATVGSAEHT